MTSLTAPKLYSPGLSLICKQFCEINKLGAPGTTEMKESIDCPVPHTTKTVHVGVINAQMSFDSCDDGKAKPAPFAGFYYEIADGDESELEKGSFKFNFNAWLQSQKSDAKWCGYFLLEILCFG
ncbi:MAG: hypothetical protein ACLPVO_00420 [Desulfomonilaceae bacterium]